MTISPKFQIVIPAEIRRRLNLTPGQRVSIMTVDDCLMFIPVRPARELMGIARGLDTTVDRDPDRD